MEDHQTLPPRVRSKKRLRDVPKVYYHEKCGAATGMPEEIIRTYLVNPWFYNNYTFCCGCNRYLHQKNFYWTETGENLHDYSLRLRRESPLRTKVAHYATGPLGLSVLGALVGLIIGVGDGKAGLGMALGLACGFLAGVAIGRFLHLMLIKMSIA